MEYSSISLDFLLNPLKSDPIVSALMSSSNDFADFLEEALMLRDNGKSDAKFAAFFALADEVALVTAFATLATLPAGSGAAVAIQARTII